MVFRYSDPIRLNYTLMKTLHSVCLGCGLEGRAVTTAVAQRACTRAWRWRTENTGCLLLRSSVSYVPDAYRCMFCFGFRCEEDPWGLPWGGYHSLSKYQLATREGVLRLSGKPLFVWNAVFWVKEVMTHFRPIWVMG